MVVEKTHIRMQLTTSGRGALSTVQGSTPPVKDVYVSTPGGDNNFGNGSISNSGAYEPQSGCMISTRDCGFRGLEGERVRPWVNAIPINRGHPVRPSPSPVVPSPTQAGHNCFGLTSNQSLRLLIATAASSTACYAFFLVTDHTC